MNNTGKSLSNEEKIMESIVSYYKDGKDSSVDDDICRVVPLWVGLFLGMIAPVIFLVAWKNFANKAVLTSASFLPLHYQPVIVLGCFIVTIVGLIFLYGIHCKYIVAIKKIAKEDRKNQREFCNNSMIVAKELYRIMYKDDKSGRNNHQEVFNINVKKESDGRNEVDK